MQRCLQLALIGQSRVAPNPTVGAVLVHNHTIIGEGFTQPYGQAHAEVHCINSVPQHWQHLIQHAILYVSLEPCNHQGNTPPCTHLIIHKKIKTVVIGCTDTHTLVNGKGIAYLQQHGVTVIQAVLEAECRLINEPFFYQKKTNLPYITLKWAMSANGYISAANKAPIAISNPYTQRYVHQLRSNNEAILVGSNTVITDNPMLTNRYFGNKQPTVMVIDRQLKVPITSWLFLHKLIIFNCIKNEIIGTVQYIKVNDDDSFLQNVCYQITELGYTNILVEGGTILLQLFISKGLYNKCITITNDALYLNSGYAAPITNFAQPQNVFTIGTDVVKIFLKKLKN